MTTSLNALAIRRTLGRSLWSPPVPFGPDGWRIDSSVQPSRVIVTCDDSQGADWVHASMSHSDHTPTYEDLVLLHRAVWGDTGYAYQVFAPASEHVNIHAYALHLWGRLDGKPVLPEFAGPLAGFPRSI